jgi:hypothetical protein
MRIVATIAGVTLAIAALTGHAYAATPINGCGFVIKNSGSYVVKKNLTVKSGGGDCITVANNFVSIDLRGFTIDCGGQTADGITDKTINFHGVMIRNGIITGCNRAIFIDSKAVLVEGVTIHANHGGIFLGNSGNLAMRNISMDNSGTPLLGGIGLFLECPSNAVDNTLIGNSFQNFRTDQAGCDSFGNLAP